MKSASFFVKYSPHAHPSQESLTRFRSEISLELRESRSVEARSTCLQSGSTICQRTPSQIRDYLQFYSLK